MRGMGASRAIVYSALFILLTPDAHAKPRVTQLLYRLEQSKGAEQMHVIAALGRSGSAEAAEALLKIFDIRKASPKQSLAIVKALGELKPPAAAVPLLGAWDYLNSMRLAQGELSTTQQGVRAELASTLGLVGDKRAATALIGALNDADPAVAQRAAEALGRLKDPRALEPLLELSKRGGEAGRSGYEAIGALGDRRAVPTLEKALREDDRAVRCQAAYALALLGDERGRESLLSLMQKEGAKSKVSLMTGYYLARLDEEDGLEALTKILRDDFNPLRLDAAEAMGKAGNRRAAGVMIEELAASKDPALRLAIVRALARLGGPKAAGALERAQADVDRSVAAVARAGLVELGHGDD